MENLTFSISNLFIPMERKSITKGLKLVDHNSLLYIYKKEIEIPLLNIRVREYHFRKCENSTLTKLNKRNLLKAYRFTEYEKELKVFLSHSHVAKKDGDTGRFKLFGIINPSIPLKAYKLLEYQFLFNKAS